MYLVGMRELFQMRSDGLGRVLACIFGGLTCGGIGSGLGHLLGPFFFPSLPESHSAEDTTAMLVMALFLLFGLGGVVFCRKLTAGLPESVPREPDIGLLSSRTRWLVIATGPVLAVTGWTAGGLYAAIFPSVLVTGALVQRHWQRYGFWMMFVPAAFLSSWMLPLGCFLLFEAARAVAFDSKMMFVSSLWATSLFLLACCDVALISEGSKLKLFSGVNS
jgi:hypothetical protein